MRAEDRGGIAPAQTTTLDVGNTAQHPPIINRATPTQEAAAIRSEGKEPDAWTVWPDEAVLRGTIRTLKLEIRETMRRLVGEVAESIAKANGATV